MSQHVRRPHATYVMGMLLAVLLLATASVAQNQEATKKTAAKVLPGRQSYMGRKIAQTMHYTGAQWLIRDEREREERCSMTLEHLGVRVGMTICDMGCGNGFYSLRLARLVTPAGRILAVDVQPQMLYMLRERAEQAGIENITPILGSMYDPRLPTASCDLILMVDVYHELSHPQLMLTAMRKRSNRMGKSCWWNIEKRTRKFPSNRCTK